MNRFNVYLNTHFQGSGCRLIARARDTCRSRDVRLYAVPGHFNVVGVSDGIDAWIAPVSAGPFFKTATGDVAKIMQALQAGEPPPQVPDAPQHRPRRALLPDGADPPITPPRRRAALAEPVPQPAQQTNPRSRRATLTSS